MPHDGLPESVRVFLRRNINSVSLLDVLFVLKKDAHRAWSPEEMSGEMRSNLSYATAQLKELVNLKLVNQEETKFRYAPGPADQEVIDEVEKLYNSRRATLINYIYSQPIDSIRDFADAFKIKKD